LGRLFGTDGVRGLANRDITAELALDLSVAAAHVLGDAGVFEGHRPTAVVVNLSAEGQTIPLVGAGRRDVLLAWEPVSASGSGVTLPGHSVAVLGPERD